MLKYLDNKVLIYIESTDRVKRFFNRKTQGFTSRIVCGHGDNFAFYDTTDKSIDVYYNSFRKHNESESIFHAMAKNDKQLHYCKTTIKSLIWEFS